MANSRRLIRVVWAQNRRQRLALGLVRCVAIALVAAGCAKLRQSAPPAEHAAPAAQQVESWELPSEARQEQERLAFLFDEVIQRYPCEVKNQVNEMVPRVHRIDWAENLGDVNGERRIPIPADIVRVWPLFRSLDFHGSGLGKPGQSIQLEMPHEKADFAYWRSKETYLSGHSNKLTVDGLVHEGYSILVKGEGRIDRITLRNAGGVSAEFDDTPWSTLGRDQPVKAVQVSVDTRKRRAIAGSVRLEREKFWRIPSHYGAHPEGAIAARDAAAYGFYPGRAIWKLDGMTRWGFGGVTLRQHPDHPGKPNYSDFDNLTFDAEADAIRQSIAPASLRQANCFDNWPPFMAMKGTRVENRRGTPADFQEAATLASAAIRWQKIVRGRHDYWWEVKNEATIPEEWVLHGEEGVDSWGELAKFHNIMADTIHAEHGDAVQVGGPASAWMALHHADFRLARQQLRFMDETKGRLDFYSHHFYEGKQLVLDAGDAFASGYLMGRLEGCLDLLRNHMILTDNVRPMLITETGTLYGREDELGIWLNSKNMSSYLIRYLEHPEKLDLVSLWFIPYAWWSREKNLYYKNDTGKLVRQDKVAYFLEQWQDFRGDRLPYTLTTADTNVHLHAVLEGRTVRVAINNLNPYRIAVDLSLLTDGARVKNIEQLRHYFDRGRIHFERLKPKNLRALPVAVEETTIITIELDRKPASQGTVNERTYYGDSLLRPTGTPATFTIDCPTDALAAAHLRVCLSRDGGFSEPMTVQLNGETVASDIVITPERKRGNFWGWHTVSLPVDLLRPENTITVDVPQAGGTITSVALIAKSLQNND